MNATKQFFIVKGRVTDVNAYGHSHVKFGDVEWQISDGLSGSRSISYDFVGSLEQAMRSVTYNHPSAFFVIK